MPILNYNNSSIEYSIEYKLRKKHISIIVEISGGVRIIAPSYFDDKKIETIVAKKAVWINKKLNEIKFKNKGIKQLEFVSGEKIAYLGKNYELKVIENASKAKITFYQGQFIAEIQANISLEEKNEKLRILLKDWYISHGLVKLNERIQYYAQKMNVSPTKIVVKEQKRSWGSCTSRGTVLFNWRILMAPLEVIDYVVVHELAHLKHLNHSRDFWYLVRTVLPNYEKQKNWLKVNGSSLIF